MTITTQTQFVEFYKQAEARAVECVAGASKTGRGKAFLKEDRAALVGAMWSLKQTPNQLGWEVQKVLGGGARHIQRLSVFESQVNKGVIRLGAKPTGEHVGKEAFEDTTFDGRIKNIADVQPAFNRAARQLIKVGITSPEAAFKYVSVAFETAKVEQKIDTKAERIVRELRMGDLTKDQILATLDRVKTQF